MSVPSVMRGASDQRGVRLWWAKNAVALVVYAIVLLLVSGDPTWIAAWAYLGVIATFIAVTGAVLSRRDPSLLAERSGYQEGAEPRDLVLASLMSVWLPLAVYVVAAIDHRGGSALPRWMQVVGLLVVAAASALALWAMAENRWFSAVLRIQRDRGHRVVTTGPYRSVRHPGYLAAVLLYVGAAAVLGSPWAFVPVAAIVVVVVVRTVGEDRVLQAELPGYPAYAARVTHRLLPGVW